MLTSFGVSTVLCAAIVVQCHDVEGQQGARVEIGDEEERLLIVSGASSLYPFLCSLHAGQRVKRSVGG